MRLLFSTPLGRVTPDYERCSCRFPVFLLRVFSWIVRWLIAEERSTKSHERIPKTRTANSKTFTATTRRAYAPSDVYAIQKDSLLKAAQHRSRRYSSRRARVCACRELSCR